MDKSLAVYDKGAESDVGRYRLLESVRQYATDRLGESGEAEAVRGLSASWFLGLAEEASPQLMGPEQVSWLERLEREHDNFRASLSWNEQSAEGGENGLRLGGALWRFWFVRGHYSEGRQWLVRALARTTPGAVGQDDAGVRAGPASGTSARAKALNGAGNLAWEQADYARARALYEESLTLVRQSGDQQGIADALGNLGNVTHSLGDSAGARALFEESLTLFRQLEDQQGIADVLFNLGNVAYHQADYARAWALFEESLTLFRQLGDQHSVALALGNLGSAASAQADYAGARALFEESLTLFRQLGSQTGIALALGNLGNVAHSQGDSSEARVLYQESLAICRQLGNQTGIVGCLEGLAGVAQGQSGRAARLGGAASALRESIGSPRSPADQAGMDETLTSAREALGDEAFTAAWDAGRAMTPEQAVEYALEGEE